MKNILFYAAYFGGYRKAQNKEHISSFNMLSITYKFSKMDGLYGISDQIN